MRITAMAVGTIMTALVVGAPAHASQLRSGLAAFGRHDYVNAHRLLRGPAEHGNPTAQGVLCFLYTEGYGVPRAYNEAAFWCTRAANQGNPQAQYMLGLLYDKGHGVPEDYILAYKWLSLAATRASGPKRDYSFRMRDAVATKMSPGQIARAQALALAWRPIPETNLSALDRAR
jgi:TPR repeat protein